MIWQGEKKKNKERRIGCRDPLLSHCRRGQERGGREKEKEGRQALCEFAARPRSNPIRAREKGEGKRGGETLSTRLSRVL